MTIDDKEWGVPQASNAKAQYKALRQKIGTQERVAAMLSVDVRTVQRRESEVGFPVTKEAMLALQQLLKR